MATIPVQPPSFAGSELSFSAAAALGDAFSNNGNQVAVFKNESVAPITVTFEGQGVDNFGVSGAGNATFDHPVSVPAGATHFLVGPFQTKRFNDTTNKVQMTYSTHVDLHVAVLGR